MKTPHLASFALGLCLLCLATPTAWARLPRPMETSGVVLAIDCETQTLVVKEGKGKKPIMLDWNKDTQFIKDGQPIAPAQLTNGESVVVFYKNVSFRNPLLKKVLWNPGTTGKGLPTKTDRNPDKKD